jgi:dihydrofolate reductase
MGNIRMYNFITLNGFFEGPGNDISWHVHGEEENMYAAEMLRRGDILLFGRITYELMASFWPTEYAIQNDPLVAEGMNKAEKIVFSRTLEKVEWNNTKLIKENITDEIRKIKQLSDRNMTILGSGSIITQFAENGLIDEFQFMVDPIILGDGTSIFNGIRNSLNLKLTQTRSFKSGIILLCYQTVG